MQSVPTWIFSARLFSTLSKSADEHILQVTYLQVIALQRGMDIKRSSSTALHTKVLTVKIQTFNNNNKKKSILPKSTFNSRVI